MPKNFMLDIVRKSFRIVFEATLYLAAAIVIIAALFSMVQGGLTGFLAAPFILLFGGAGIVIYGGVISIFINIDKNLEKLAKNVAKDSTFDDVSSTDSQNIGNNDSTF
ncbi:MAG: hypothetical protein FWE29_00575 [Defluviitaleaceae bacterium]|nr:hypothetical protein [Defluviitaleaceae bacterium]